MSFANYHFHLYFSEEQKNHAEYLRETLKCEYGLEVGRLWDKPVGPHPVRSCQITVNNEKFKSVMDWLLVNRDGVDVFIHPIDKDDLKDHTEYAIWIGKSYDLDLSIFNK